MEAEEERGRRKEQNGRERAGKGETEWEQDEKER